MIRNYLGTVGIKTPFKNMKKPLVEPGSEMGEEETLSVSWEIPSSLDLL